MNIFKRKKVRIVLLNAYLGIGIDQITPSPNYELDIDITQKIRNKSNNIHVHDYNNRHMYSSISKSAKNKGDKLNSRNRVKNRGKRFVPEPI